uniref:Putative secreted peptide n=1 Tax=Anopheles braziliensis TaxID=58242 RepID=A0A2M3ZV22_9DIPT
MEAAVWPVVMLLVQHRRTVAAVVVALGEHQPVHCPWPNRSPVPATMSRCSVPIRHPVTVRSGNSCASCAITFHYPVLCFPVGTRASVQFASPN